MPLLYSHLHLGEHFDEIFELIKFSVAKCNTILKGNIPISHRNNLSKMLLNHNLIISSRNFNMHFKYSPEIKNLLDQQCLLAQQCLTNIVDFSRLSIQTITNIVKYLMMTEKYDEIVEKYLPKINQINFQKIIKELECK